MLQNNSAKYFRYDINALRAIAIIGVLLYHYKVELFSGGFTGVDVFFVISGYLMSRVVIGQIDKGTFSFNEYFERRLHRIVPALLFLVAVLTVVCFFFYLPDDYKASLKNAASSILFLSNIFYWYNSPSYFDASADTNMFLHTWSLSVEWQFYLVYPFVLLLFNKIFKSKRTFKIVFIALTIFVFVMSVIVSNYNSSASFYLLPTRSWEMLFGGIAFFAEGKLRGAVLTKIIAIVGYLLILASFFALKESLLWPGFYTLIPVAGAFLVIIANYNDFKIVRNNSLQFIGKISYSLYLWHWPVYVVAQYYGIGTGFAAVLGYCLLSVVLGYTSYRCVETLQFSGKRTIATIAAGLLIGVFSIQYFNSNRIMYSNKTLAIAANSGIKRKPFFSQYRKDTCFVESMASYKKNTCLCFEGGKKNILLIGDSHLAQLSQSLREEFKDVNFLQATATGTLPTVKSYYNKKKNLRVLMDYVFYEFIPKNAGKIDGVIISGNWAGQSVVDKQAILHGLKETTAYLKRYKIKAIVIGQTERYTVPYPVIAARSYEYGIDNNQFYLDDYAISLNNFLSPNLKGSYVDLINTSSFPALSAKNQTYMRDKDHLTKYGADLLVQKIKQDSIAKAFFENTKKPFEKK
ncbi:acyltransferase family protein [Flavobacterium subsaxonicum]|uniref:acyltransferase family protein n=1 Tax=Flavobacterium subsaxonicum TaxID=426226 RepID=UPI000423A845|nr:acyltransferase family protein [Flavobacterium subsaxonicum]